MTARVGLRRWAVPVAVVVALAASPSALAGLRIARVDLGDYPLVRATVVAPSVSTPAPQVRENGQTVQGLTAQRAPGKSVVLAIDRSDSMRGAPLARAAEAVRGFIDSKPTDDQVAVVSFGASALQLTSFSDTTIDADQALRGLAIDLQQGTALYDAVDLGSRMLSTQPSHVRLLIVLTDGADHGSQATITEALATARAAGVAVYTVGVESPQFTPAVLQRISRQTGGSYYPATVANLDGVYARIAAELRRTWDVEYVTKARPGDRIALRVSAGGAGAATTTATIPRSAGRAAQSGSSSHGWLVPVIVGLLVGLVVFGTLRRYQSRNASRRLRHHLEPYTDSRAAVARRRFEADRWRVLLAPLFRATERALAGARILDKLETRLVRADLPFRTVEFLWIMVAAGLVLALIFGLALGIWAALGFFVVGAYVPYFVVTVKGQRRQRAFEAQLPTALTSLAASLSAGHSFPQALQGLVDNSSPPLESEFRRVLTDTRLGVRMDAALLAMGKRMASKDLDFVVRAVIVQRQVGGSLAGLFELVADTVQKRQQFRVKVRSLTAMGRLSAAVLIALPFFVALAVSAINHSYLSPLFTTSPGHVMLIAGGVMMVIGTLILRRMVNMKV